MNIKEKGITRLPCFLLLFASIMVGYCIKLYTGHIDFTGNVVTYILFTCVLYFRMKNIGWNPLFSLLGLLPIINLFLLLPAIAFPENYASDKKLDLRGKIMIGVFIIIYIVPTFIISTRVSINNAMQKAALQKAERETTATHSAKP